MADVKIDPRIEALSRYMCSADGHDPDWTPENYIAQWMFECYIDDARGVVETLDKVPGLKLSLVDPAPERS